MKRIILSFVLAFLWCGLSAQTMDVFQRVEQQYPEMPVGLLQAIAFTNTQCHHLTDADYVVEADDPSAMPRAYGMMGLVRDGKGYFNANLPKIAALSGYSEEDILADPEVNVSAYAKALLLVAKRMQVKMDSAESYAPAIIELSELPLRDQKDQLPMMMMLYSVYAYLGSDLEELFGEDYAILSASALSVSKETDYPYALWVPAPECNYEERTKPVSAVVIHYTEGSYAGCISWFQNCDSEVSAHYVIRSFDGQVTQMVRERDKAWHARSANGYSIGIEHEAYGDIQSFFTDAMYASSANLVRDICSRYETIDGHRTFYFDTLDNGTALNSGLHDLGGEEACIKIRGHQHFPDQTHTDPGPYWNWNYYYKLINEGSQVIHLGGNGVESGSIQHVNYGDDERRIWVIESAENTAITLSFNKFNLEPDFDFLWIYDGNSVYAPKIGRWNTQSPGIVTSSGNAICIEFRSDCATTGEGWRARWMVNHTDTSEEEQAFIKVFPIPSDDRVTISCPDMARYQMRVVDALGRVMLQTAFRFSVDLGISNWPQGVYVIQCKRVDDGAVFTSRIIR